MISGIDSTLENHWLKQYPEAILFACLSQWPDCLYQQADEEGFRPVQDVILTPHVIDPEFFVYKDRQSYQSWEDEGATPENSDTMLHFIIRNHSKDDHRPASLTIVSDRRSDEIAQIEELINQGPSRILSRINYQHQSADEATLSPNVILLSVLKSLHLHFYNIQHKVILLNPAVADTFCNMVRKESSTDVPDNHIMHVVYLLSLYQDMGLPVATTTSPNGSGSKRI